MASAIFLSTFVRGELTWFLLKIVKQNALSSSLKMSCKAPEMVT